MLAPPSVLLALVLQFALAAAGLVLLWRHVLSPAARKAAGPSPLPYWDPEVVEFLVLMLLVTLGVFFFASLGAVLSRQFGLKGDAANIAAGAGQQFGMLAAMLAFASRSPGFRVQAKRRGGDIIRSGVGTFLISLPILHLASQLWEWFLRLLGIEAKRQDLVRVFNEADSRLFLGSLVFLAIVIAPVAEELVFRAGIFRFLRSRVPKFVALLLPATAFAALHVNWSTLDGLVSFVPLILLAVIYSLAYERSGNIGTTIVAHGLFNLNTIVMILCGLGE